MHAYERRSAGALIAAVLCGGCAPAEQSGDPTATISSAATLGNGLHLNGLHLNGLHLNGLHLNGLHLNGLHLNGVTLTGASFSGANSSGGAIQGSDFIGAGVDGTLSDGSHVSLRIDDVAAGQEPDISLYAVSYRVGDGSWQALCGTDSEGAAVKSMPLRGTWDESEGTATGGAHLDQPDTFTFACEGFALAKCVEMGYAPWRSANECRASGDCRTFALSPAHQACTRMLRADYCGDGTSTTRDGTMVDVWDNLGLQTDDAPTWTFEAEWSTGGAVCVDATRWPTIAATGADVEGYIADHCPSRWQTPGCGGDSSTFFTANGFTTPLTTRSLLRTRITPQQP